MKPTDTSDPDYFHRVVDCQWACPAHTNVPEYIRLIAAGRYDDAYMLNRRSNVFPGILGRTCDRPCEPACRRGRIDGEPVAICRLKRVAADLRGGIEPRLPAIPEQKNGKRIACIGAGPASLTVANDLMPLGYAVTVFEKLAKPGGLMWTNIPEFRLPADVLWDEIGQITGMGVNVRTDTAVASLAALLAGGVDGAFDAVFIGSGAPRGKELPLPGRWDSDDVHVGIEWLESVRFGHVRKAGARVLVIGVGNTAMDCCRTAIRLGAQEVKIMARKDRSQFKASPWELEDAEAEGVAIVENHSPSRFVVESGKLVGMEFERVSWRAGDDGRLHKQVHDVMVAPCDEVILAIGQDTAFPWIERDIGMVFTDHDMPVVDQTTFQTTLPSVFAGGDAAWGPNNIIWAVEHGHQAAISIHAHCTGQALQPRPRPRMRLQREKMGLHEWAYSNCYDEALRAQSRRVPIERTRARLSVEAELGLDPHQAQQEVERCLNCDMQTFFTESLCIECDACVDVCPLSCLTITGNGKQDEVRKRLRAPALHPEQPLLVSGALPHTGRNMFKDEDLCVHCGLCAERCPTAAWDMRRSVLQLPYAGLEAGQAHPVRATTVETI